MNFADKAGLLATRDQHRQLFVEWVRIQEPADLLRYYEELVSDYRKADILQAVGFALAAFGLLTAILEEQGATLVLDDEPSRRERPGQNFFIDPAGAKE